MKEELIKSIKRTTKLYRQPSRIGDVIEYGGKNWLIIGIQDVQIRYTQLEILYVCQNLEMDYLLQPNTISKEGTLTSFQVTIRTGSEHILERVSLGRLFRDDNNNPYQAVEYTDVEIEFTDIVVTLLAKPIKPVPRQEAKAKLLHERKKKLNLTLL